MTHDRHVYGKIESEAGMRQIFDDIRHDVANAGDRPALTELYRRAGYLITLTYAPSWREKFGPKDASLREAAEEEFRKTAKEINQRAVRIGTDADYHETWGHEG
jgi:hypothetical protein